MKKCKAYIIKRIVPLIILCVFVISGLIKINIINTKNLSPFGNTNENYLMVSNEFGNDFSNFIKDNSNIKIYCDSDDSILIKVWNIDFKVKKIKSVIHDFDEVTNWIGEKIKYVHDKVIGKNI